MAVKLYVGGLAYSVTQKELEALFSEQGQVTSAVLIMDRDTGQSKGFGFVEMNDSEDAQKAIKALNGSAFNGRSIIVNEARPQEDRRGGGGGGGGGYRRSY